MTPRSPRMPRGGPVKDQGLRRGHGTGTAANWFAEHMAVTRWAYGVGSNSWSMGPGKSKGTGQTEDGHTGGSGRGFLGRSPPAHLRDTHRPHLAADLAHAACCDGLKRSFFERARVKFLGAENALPAETA